MNEEKQNNKKIQEKIRQEILEWNRTHNTPIDSKITLPKWMRK